MDALPFFFHSIAHQESKTSMACVPHVALGCYL